MNKSIVETANKDIEAIQGVGERDNMAFARYMRAKYEYKSIYSFTLPGAELNKTISTLVCVTRKNQVYVAFGQMIDDEWEVSRIPAQII